MKKIGSGSWETSSLLPMMKMPSERKSFHGPARTGNSEPENCFLQLLEKITSRARDINPARDAPFAVLHPLHNPCRLAALWAVRALGRVHDLLAVRRLCNLHWHDFSPDLGEMI